MPALPPNRLLFAAALAALLSACAGKPPQPSVSAQLEPRSGSSVSGTVNFIQVGENTTRIEAVVHGLTPGEHGFHVHEAGDCSAPDASTAKGHFNPNSKAHGYYASGEHHAGDMPNLVADAKGNARYAAEVAGMHLATGPVGIIGRSIVVHADPDDYKSQPAGNSGKRIACGAIRKG